MKPSVGHVHRSWPHFFDNVVIGMVVIVVFGGISFHKWNVVRVGNDFRRAGSKINEDYNMRTVEPFAGLVATECFKNKNFGDLLPF